MRSRGGCPSWLGAGRVPATGRTLWWNSDGPGRQEPRPGPAARGSCAEFPRSISNRSWPALARPTAALDRTTRSASPRRGFRMAAASGAQSLKDLGSLAAHRHMVVLGRFLQCLDVLVAPFRGKGVQGLFPQERVLPEQESCQIVRRGNNGLQRRASACQRRVRVRTSLTATVGPTASHFVLGSSRIKRPCAPPRYRFP